MLVPLVARADVGPPAHMQVTETSPGRYVVQWRVPKALPARAVPAPLLPETCRPTGEKPHPAMAIHGPVQAPSGPSLVIELQTT